MKNSVEVKATLSGEVHFDVKLGSGYRLEVDGAREVGGTGLGGRPMEMVLAGTTCCTGIDVILMLRKARQDVTGFEIVTKGERAEKEPKVFTHIQLEYRVRGRNLSEDAVRRAIELSETKYCSAISMLRPTVKIESTYKIEQEP